MYMKKNNILKYLMGGAAAVTMLASCEMNLLPTTSIAYDEGNPIFLTADDVQAFQNGVMVSYRSLNYGVYYQTSEVMTANFNATNDYGNNYGSNHRCDDGFTPDDYNTQDMWSGHYSAIKNYNIAIANADKVAEELKDDAQILKGISLFCRASSYLTLTRHFGMVYNPATAATDLSVPLVTVYDQLKKAERATVKQVYDQIIADLNAAEEILSAAAASGKTVKVAQSSVKLAGQVRAEVPTVDAVKALKARYYLDTQDYAKAAEMAEAVIASPAGYALASNSAQMKAEYTDDNGTEPIVQLYASQAEGAVGCTMYTYVRNEEAGKCFGPYYLPSKYLLDHYESDDLRLQTWFTNSLYPVKMSGSLHSGVYVFVKYLDNPALHEGTVETGAHKAKTLLISEMYLIAAEAHAMNNAAASAKAALNALQAKRGATQTEATMENIKKEWLKETVGEGLYFTCVKRWGDGFPARPGHPAAEGLLVNTVNFQDRVLPADSRFFNWPIPTYEMQLNKELQQNPGYTIQ